MTGTVRVSSPPPPAPVPSEAEAFSAADSDEEDGSAAEASASPAASPDLPAGRASSEAPDSDAPELAVEPVDFDEMDIDVDEDEDDASRYDTVPGQTVDLARRTAVAEEADEDWLEDAATEVRSDDRGPSTAAGGSEGSEDGDARPDEDEAREQEVGGGSSAKADASELDLEEVEPDDEDELDLEEVDEDHPAPPPAPAEGSVAGGPPPVPNDAGAELGSGEPTAAEAADSAARSPKARPWFDEFFNDDYLRTVPVPTDQWVSRQCDFIEQTLGLEKGATILDVGCGLGLHAVELASRGYLIVGLDLSLPMLSRAADEAQDRGLKMNFLHADMREMTFDGAFDAVLCWGTTFGYFDDETNREVVERLYRALKPMGLLLLDVVNRDHVIPSQPNLVWFEGDGCVCMEETQLNYITSRLQVKRTVILDDGRQRESHYSIRLYSLHELGQILHQKGFRVAQVSGLEATPGVFLGADSPRMIILAERRLQGKESASTPPSDFDASNDGG
jgi:SAM-dependent methyltransferase